MSDQCSGFASPCDEGAAFDAMRGEGGAHSLSPLFSGERVRVRGGHERRSKRLPLTPTLSP